MRTWLLGPRGGHPSLVTFSLSSKAFWEDPPIPTEPQNKRNFLPHAVPGNQGILLSLSRLHWRHKPAMQRLCHGRHLPSTEAALPIGPASPITKGRAKGVGERGRAKEISLKATTTQKKSLRVGKMKVEFAMQEGLLIDSFQLDGGVLLTYIYFLITQNWIINLSLDSACHANEWMRIPSVSDQPSGRKVILVFTTRSARLCGRASSPPRLYFSHGGVSPKETSF